MTTPAARYKAGRRALPDTGDSLDTDHLDPDDTMIISEHTVTARGQIRLTGLGIGLGSQWAGSRVTAFTTGDHVLIFYRDEIVRELTLDHTRRFQPTGQPRGGHRRLRISDTVH
jgi:hypothetical protein